MTSNSIPTRDRLIVALDVPTTDEARAIVEALGDSVSFYKIGLQLFPVGGLDLARDLIQCGKKVFLDFKLYDIGNTVRNAVINLKHAGATFLTIHGDHDIVTSAVAGRGEAPLQLLAVTVLTSMSEDSLRAMGYSGSLGELVLARARLALDAGCDGIVASAREAALLRRELGDAFPIVTPGIRSAGAAHDDQKRVATPGEALRAGADYLVVGREITAAADRRRAALNICAQIENACRAR